MSSRKVLRHFIHFSFFTIMALSDFDLVLFGGSGDLAMRKLLPAMYARERAKDLPASARILCVGRHEMTQEAFLEAVNSTSNLGFRCAKSIP